MTGQLLTVSEVACRLGISTRSVFRLIRTGHLAATGLHGMARTRRVSESALNAFLEESNPAQQEHRND